MGLRRPTLIGAAIGLAVGAVLVLRRAQKPAAPQPQTGRAARSAELARVASRAGRTYATTSARQVFASAGRKEQLRSERQLRTAAEVVEALLVRELALVFFGSSALPSPANRS